MATINVGRDFSKFPSGRLKRNGSTSGEAFRDKFLIPALEAGERLVIELDGAIGYGSSFLEEAFGGAVRATGMSTSQVLALIELVTNDVALKDEIVGYMRDAEPALKKA